MRCALAPLVALCLAQLPTPPPLSPITLVSPLNDSLFPPDFAAPLFEWRDSSAATLWEIEVAFSNGSTRLRLRTAGEAPRVGPLDRRVIGPTNELPRLSPERAAAHLWRPDEPTWAALRAGSAGAPATIRITGYAGSRAVSQGQLRIETSSDPVGAPIFYRDVPLMPSELEKGVIKPLAPKLLPLVAWRLRNVGEPASRVVMEGIHTCANCHSFSRDGKTLGLDLDGPHNDKGLYAILPVTRQMSIRQSDVISWRAFRGQMAPDQRIGFMSQLSPDGRVVITTTQVEYYVANFKDYRFLQVFYPTRGILAWYNRADGRMRALPGADHPRYVQSNAVWSPDGQYLVFARASARAAYPEGGKMAEFALDPAEVQIRYDLYRIPFNSGRGGTPVPIEGASNNGMSNSFPKISPDGRWLIYVQSRNGQLMRPDSELYIVPVAGGRARRLRANTARMNSWHSFSPNGRWLVFSSKANSPYTQLYLTHIDEQGNDSPAILIENSTAANRAANIPEFLNAPVDAIARLDAPATEFYRLYDAAWDLTEKGRIDEALAAWTRALQLDPADAKARNNLAGLLLRQGKLDQAAVHFQKVLEINPEFTEVRNNLGLILMQQGHLDQAMAEWRRSLEITPSSMEAHFNLGNALLMRGQFAPALAEWEAARQLDPGRLPVLTNMAWLLSACPDARVRHGARAVELAELALKLSPRPDARLYDTLGAAYAEAGRFTEALTSVRHAIELAPGDPALKAREALYASGHAYHDSK
jgi:Flp pilus assembly protein TadD